MSIREAMVRRVLGEKWLVIMILMPASEKDSWWGYADSSSSTISTDGFLWWLAVGHTHMHVIEQYPHARMTAHIEHIHPLHPITVISVLEHLVQEHTKKWTGPK